MQKHFQNSNTQNYVCDEMQEVYPEKYLNGTVEAA
jgi:hypothetical protein